MLPSAKIVFFDIDDTILSNDVRAQNLPHCREFTFISKQCWLLYPNLLKPILKFCVKYHVLGFISTGLYTREQIVKVLQEQFAFTSDEVQEVLFFSPLMYTEAGYLKYLLDRRISQADFPDDRKQLQAQYLLQSDAGKARLRAKRGNEQYQKIDLVFIDDQERFRRGFVGIAHFIFAANGLEGDLTYLAQVAAVTSLSGYAGQMTQEGREYLLALRLMRIAQPATTNTTSPDDRGLQQVISGLQQALLNYSAWFDENATGVRLQHFLHSSEERQLATEVYAITGQVGFLSALAQLLQKTNHHEHSPWFFIVRNMRDNKEAYPDVMLRDEFYLKAQIFQFANLKDERSAYIVKLYLAHYLRALLSLRISDTGERQQYAVSDQGLSSIFTVVAQEMHNFIIWYLNDASGFRVSNLAYSEKDREYAEAVLFSLRAEDFFDRLDACLRFSTREPTGVWCYVLKALKSNPVLEKVEVYAITVVDEAKYSSDRIAFMIAYMRAYIKLIAGRLRGLGVNDIPYNAKTNIINILDGTKRVLESKDNPQHEIFAMNE